MLKETIEDREKRIKELSEKVDECETRYNRIALTNIFGRSASEKEKINKEYANAQTEMFKARDELRKAMGF